MFKKFPSPQIEKNLLPKHTPFPSKIKRIIALKPFLSLLLDYCYCNSGHN